MNEIRVMRYMTPEERDIFYRKPGSQRKRFGKRKMAAPAGHHFQSVLKKLLISIVYRDRVTDKGVNP